MKSRVTALVCLAGFSLTASAMPHASLNQLVQQSDPNCTQTGGDNGFKDLIQQVNLFSRQNPVFNTTDPRGLLEVMAPALNLEKHKDHLREVVGDIFCPGISKSSQGTGILIDDDGTLLTSAHVLLEPVPRNHPNYHDRHDFEALQTCFWQNKVPGSKRIKLDPETFRPLTRDPDGEFDKDLGLIRLKTTAETLHRLHPIQIDNSNDPVRPGDEFIMASAYQEKLPYRPNDKRVPTDSVKVDLQKIPLGSLKAAIFERIADVIVQSCSAIYVAPKTEKIITNGIYGDCSATEGASGSALFIVRNGEIFLKGILKAGGGEKADNKPFTWGSKSSYGASFSYSIQLNQAITDQIQQSQQALNEKGRTRVRASLEQ